MEAITLTIDGERVSSPPQASILEAAEQHGIKIPRLCHHKDLKPVGACRLCLVEEEKSGRVLASCVTPVAPDMLIVTQSPRIIKHRRNVVRLMMAEHPESCLVCSKGNRCQLRNIAAQLGVGQQDIYPMPNYRSLEQANPFIIRDLSKCILCGKCVRADHELVVVGAIDYNLRGFNSRPATLYDLPLEESNCTFCGTCVSMCPTGALSPKNTRFIGSPQEETPSVCGFCGVGCSLNMGVAFGKVVEVGPSQFPHSVNGSTLCVRGHFAHDFLNARERLTQPSVRCNHEMTPATWEEALGLVSGRLLEIRENNGPQSIGFFGSSKCTNEENYLFQKIARALLGTNNVESGGALYGRSAFALMEERTSGGCRTNRLEGLENAEAILVLGADPNHSMPVMSYFIKRAATKGTPIIVVDPRRTELTPYSTLWLAPNPHTDLDLLNALASLLIQRGAQDSTFIEKYTEGFSTYKEGILALDMERIYRVTGIDQTSLEKAADVLASSRFACIIGNGLFQQRYGLHSMDALVNLSLITGSLGHYGGGVYIISKDNNQVGAWDMGAAPDFLPGRLPLEDAEGRKHWERAWQVNISPDCGLSIMRMVEEAEKGNLKALYIMGENPLRSLPQSARVREALSTLDFVVVQDILETETAGIAHVLLPGAAFAEKGGSFTNTEGRIQCFDQAVSPPGDAKPDWEILDALSARMGAQKTYGSLKTLRAEIAQFIPMYADLGREPDTGWVQSVNEQSLFDPQGIKARIRFSEVNSCEEKPEGEDYPFTAILGTLRYHLGSGTRTGFSERIQGLALGGEIEISPDAGQSLGLGDGDRVRVHSPEGSMERGIRVSRNLRGKLVFIPEGFGGNEGRNLIGFNTMDTRDSPGLKESRVRMERI